MEYENFLTEKLNNLKDELGIDVDILVSTEQAYAKLKSFKPKTIYVIIKYLASDITFGAREQPIQIVCSSEQNSVADAQILLTAFTERFNFFTSLIDGVFTKHRYSTPVVLANFEEVGIGYRSQLYFTGSIIVMNDVIDVNSLEIDDVATETLGFNLSYQMTTNSQQRANEPLATSVKSSATFSISLTIPLIETALTTKVVSIMNGASGYDGNNDFKIEFLLAGISFNLNMKLTSSQIITAPNQIPSLQIGLVK